MEASSPVGCTIQTLPRELIIPAARTAVEEDPRNEPAIAQFATVADNDDVDRILTPLHIAAMTTKYFGPKTLVLPVFFMDNPDEAIRKTILQHANIWSDHGCGISYVETRKQGDSRVRIGRGPLGHFSYLGTDIYHIDVNTITMNLQGFTSRTDPRELMRVIPHEFGHTQGCPHEHAQAEIIAKLKREAVIQHYMRTQGWSRQQVIAQIFTPLEQASIMGTPPDVTSIMCYRFEAFLTVDNVPIYGGLEPNESDYAFMAKIYPKTGGGDPLPKPPVEPPPKPEPKPPVEPPDTIPRLMYRRWSKVMQYTQKTGPVQFVFTAPKEDAYAVQVEGAGRWLVEAVPVSSLESAPVNLKEGVGDVFYAAFEPTQYLLSVQPKVVHRTAKFRVRLI